MPLGFRSSQERRIIVHFHFFKNAGTSVESILRAHFGKRFATYEPGGPAETFPAGALEPFLQKNPSLAAVSSHTIHFPPPERKGWTVFPIVFLRHPLDRVLSMYNFEKNQDSDSPGALLARETGPAAYITERLRNPGERTLRNYQAWMLAQHLAPGGSDEDLLEAARRVIMELPVVGMVDRFAESIHYFNRWLAPYFPGLDMSPEHRNSSPLSSLGVSGRLARLREETGADLYARLEAENRIDLELYRLANERMASENPFTRES
ncbi:MAG: hypothetical protein PVI83_10015 [Lysobacterales bacterium]|jgi:hypothetical protein